MFDESKAARAVRFIELLKHTGDYHGIPFEPLEWERKIVREVFGTMHPNDPERRLYRTVYLETPKKNGKSELAAGVALRLLFADSEPGAEIYSAAADREQASIVFHVAAEMVRMNKKLGQRCKVLDSTKRIIHNNGNIYRVLSADVHTKHGFNTHGVIFDELHAQPTRELWDVLTQGAGDARRQPVVFAITTAGSARHSLAQCRR